MHASPQQSPAIADLELIKQATARRGVPEAEILREGIKLAAMGARIWDEPLIRDDETFDLGGRLTPEDIRDAVRRAADGRRSVPEPRCSRLPTPLAC
ncbi:MAG: hypothetical protein M0T77_07075 [Actinomycetota bacterium]|nr:hypothetical protein [Actinomycetota bacterium]